MLVESGLALALESDKLKGGGGIFTPGTCQVINNILRMFGLCD